jgi:hypothetical protein
MYRSTFAHLNTNYEVPTSTINPVPTTAKRDSRRNAPRRRRRLVFGFARPAPRGGC